MSDRWMDLLFVIGVQQLWQSAILLLLALLVFRLRRPSAQARSWMWFCVFLLATVSPLAVLLPGDAVTAGAMPNASGTTAAPAARVIAAASAVAGETPSTGALLSWLKPVAVLAWMLGTLRGVGRLWTGWYRARRLRDGARSSPYLERLLRGELPANAMVRTSADIRSPMVVGLARPCILVPRALVAELPEAALHDVLLHEIAHVLRGDMWSSLAQQALAAIYWWNPFLRLIGSRLDLEREMACDAFAAMRSGEGRRYARSLLSSAEQALSFPDPRVLASGMLDGRKGLHRRIEGVLEMEMKTAPSRIKPALILFGLMLASSVTLTLAATPRMGTPGGLTADARLLVEAAGHGRLDEVQELLRRGVDIDVAVPGDGTALIAAARAGDERMIITLLRRGADVDRPSRGDGNPLIAASMAGHSEAVGLLLAFGADVDAVVRGDETALINAARGGHLQVVKYLVAHGANVNLGVRADFGQWRSPLNQARSRDVRDYLISKGAVPDKT
jgi:beta-lactamase regulating signal transducer with metallopeptidase domain